MPSESKTVALIGKLGHGKTRVLNLLCGTHHVSQGGCESQTRTVEYGYSKRKKIFVIGTPGLGPTEDVAQHIAAQKLALEFSPLYGVYLIVKCGRGGDMIDEQIDDIIDMVGADNIRIIATHADVEAQKSGYNEEAVKRTVAKLSDISASHVMVVGLETIAKTIEDFIFATLLPQPKSFRLSDGEVAALAKRSKQSRSISKDIRDVYAKIDAAASFLDRLTSSGKGKSSVHDITILDTQHEVSVMVKEDKENIFRKAWTNDEQFVCYAQAGPSLSVKLKQFVEKTNTFLSWNVADATDPRNHYKACNNCGAVYIKVEGCDEATTCGAVPTTRDTAQTSMASPASAYIWTRVGSSWEFNSIKRLGGLIGSASAHLRFPGRASSNGGVHIKRDGALIESGCGQTISWATMHPIELELVQQLASVELNKAGTFEELSNNSFDNDLRAHVEINKEILKDGRHT